MMVSESSKRADVLSLGFITKPLLTRFAKTILLRLVFTNA